MTNVLFFAGGSFCIIVSTILLGWLGPVRERELGGLRDKAREIQKMIDLLIQDHNAFQNMETRGLMLRDNANILNAINRTLEHTDIEAIIKQIKENMIITKHGSLVTLSTKLGYTDEEMLSWEKLDFEGLEKQKLDSVMKWGEVLKVLVTSLDYVEQDLSSKVKEKSWLYFISLVFQVGGLALILYSKL